MVVLDDIVNAATPMNAADRNAFKRKIKKDTDMEKPNQEQKNKIFIGLGIFAALMMGSLVGAGTMLFLAPRSGKKTRAQIQRKTLELRDQTTEAVEDIVSLAGVKVRQVRAGMRKQAKKLEKRGQAKFKEQKKRLSTLVEAGVTAVQG